MSEGRPSCSVAASGPARRWRCGGMWGEMGRDGVWACSRRWRRGEIWGETGRNGEICVGRNGVRACSAMESRMAEARLSNSRLTPSSCSSIASTKGWSLTCLQPYSLST